jgi:hypothetical protein
MKISDIITEKRKFPEQNPKTSINQQIIDIYADAPMLNDNETNCFVSFTHIDKLGVNPNSQHDTPLGIYAIMQIIFLSLAIALMQMYSNAKVI